MNTRPTPLGLTGALLSLALLAAILYYPWVLVRAKFELGGSASPSVAGHVADVRLRAAQQYCTGIVSSGEQLWLVSRMDGGGPEPSADSVQLGAGAPEAGSLLQSWLGLSRSETVTSRLLRLEPDRRFREVAWMNEAFCLTASPDGRTLFALTGLKRPPDSGIYQSQVLRSDDAGASWQAVEGAFMNPEQTVAWSMRLHFHGDNELWSVGEPPVSDWQTYEKPSIGLAYSSDRGISATPVRHAESLLLTLEEIRAHAPDWANWGDYNGQHGRIRTELVQLDADNALYWISQSFMYGPADGPYLDTTLNFSSRIHLQRQADDWRVVSVERSNGESLSQVQRSPGGKIIGLLTTDDWQQRIVELDPQTLQWRTLGTPPNLFAPFPAGNGISELRVGRNTLLAVVSGEHEIPLWLTPSRSEPATVSASGVYYSVDWGRSWKKLPIAGYLGLLGFDPEQDRVFWGEGEWYESNDTNIYQAQLR